MTELTHRLKKMSEKLETRSKSKLAAILLKSNCDQSKAEIKEDPPRRNSVPASGNFPSQQLASTLPNAFFTHNPIYDATSSSGVRPRTLSTPGNIATLPSARLRLGRSPISPSSPPISHRRMIGLSAREQRVAYERQAVTRESEQCHDKLCLEGVRIRDFQAEHNDELLHSQKANAAQSEAATSQPHTQKPDSEPLSKKEVVMGCGRINAGPAGVGAARTC